MGRLDDSTVRLSLPLDASTGSLVVGPVRSFLRLCHFPRPASEFIASRLAGALRRIKGKPASRPPRVAVTLRCRSGRIRVALKISGARADDLRLASLARGGPPEVKAEYRPGTGGGTLAFTSLKKRKV